MTVPGRVQKPSLRAGPAWRYPPAERVAWVPQAGGRGRKRALTMSQSVRCYLHPSARRLYVKYRTRINRTTIPIQIIRLVHRKDICYRMFDHVVTDTNIGSLRDTQKADGLPR